MLGHFLFRKLFVTTFLPTPQILWNRNANTNKFILEDTEEKGFIWNSHIQKNKTVNSKQLNVIILNRLSNYSYISGDRGPAPTLVNRGPTPELSVACSVIQLWDGAIGISYRIYVVKHRWCRVVIWLHLSIHCICRCRHVYMNSICVATYMV